MSSVDEIFSKIGQGEGEPVQNNTTARYRLTKKDLMKVLEKMPDNAAIWNVIPGQSDYDAKNAIRDALWETVKPAVKRVIMTPSGQYMESNE